MINKIPAEHTFLNNFNLSLLGFSFLGTYISLMIAGGSGKPLLSFMALIIPGDQGLNADPPTCPVPSPHEVYSPSSPFDRFRSLKESLTYKKNKDCNQVKPTTMHRINWNKVCDETNSHCVILCRLSQIF